MVKSVSKCSEYIHLYSRTFLTELTLDWTRQREKWHQTLLVKYTQNCMLPGQ